MVHPIEKDPTANRSVNAPDKRNARYNQKDNKKLDVEWNFEFKAWHTNFTIKKFKDPKEKNQYRGDGLLINLEASSIKWCLEKIEN